MKTTDNTHIDPKGGLNHYFGSDPLLCCFNACYTSAAIGLVINYCIDYIRNLPQHTASVSVSGKFAIINEAG